MLHKVDNLDKADDAGIQAIEKLMQVVLDCDIRISKECNELFTKHFKTPLDADKMPLLTKVLKNPTVKIQRDRDNPNKKGDKKDKKEKSKVWATISSITHV